MPEVSVEKVTRFMRECLQTTGVSEAEASEHTALLLFADFTGHFSHGLNRLDYYITRLQSGAINPRGQPVILKETSSTAWVDGGDALGATVGNFCMELAIKKAKESGVGWVVTKGCTHFGMAGWWAQQAEKQGFIGMAFTNTASVLVPTRAKDAALGNNPLAVAAPGSGGESLLVDFATTVAVGKIEMKIQEENPLPDGWAMNENGDMTNDAKVGYASGRLYPLGGGEETCGYKGYCLSAMNEVFCSALSGAKPSHERPWWRGTTPTEPPNLGQVFVAIDPGCFAPGFGDRVAAYLGYWRNLPPVNPELPVLAPGDKQRSNFEQTEKRGSIVYGPKQIESCAALAGRLGVSCLRTL